MSKKAEKILKKVLQRIIPRDSKTGRSNLPHGEIKKLAKAAGIVPDTINRIHSRQSLSSITLIDLLLARGVHEDSIVNISFTEPTKINKGLVEWNDFGLQLTPEQRKELIKLCSYLLEDWKLKE